MYTLLVLRAWSILLLTSLHLALKSPLCTGVQLFPICYFIISSSRIILCLYCPMVWCWYTYCQHELYLWHRYYTPWCLFFIDWYCRNMSCFSCLWMRIFPLRCNMMVIVPMYTIWFLFIRARSIMARFLFALKITSVY
jgi:hypothetical protein